MKSGTTLMLLCLLSAVFAAGCVGKQTPTPQKKAPPPTSVSSTVSATSIPALVESTLQREVETPAGTPDPAFTVNVYKADKVWPGTTLFNDNHNPARPRVVEVNMRGEVVWEYALPAELKEYTNPGFDVEPLASGNILIVLPRKGVYEISRGGDVVWKYLDEKVSHDADRLPNGNTLIVYGNEDTQDDAQAKEVDPQGKIVWSWRAGDHFTSKKYTTVSRQGWTHANAATRLDNGHTLISLRNFNFIAEVDEDGTLVKKIGEGLLHRQHDPAVLSNGNILIADHGQPQGAVELDPDSGEVVWRFDVTKRKMWPVRDANRLPNGNTLITGTTAIIEVTADGERVWTLNLADASFKREEAAGRGFYKAERIS